MNCLYCGKEFDGRKKKYCSNECCYNADKDRKRIRYEWKSERADFCIVCGQPIPDRNKLYCSVDCRRGKVKKTKRCIVCGKEFVTTRSGKLTCSAECSKRNYYSKKTSRTDRYKDITIDKDINVERLALRDNNICKICGKPVNWNDKREINGLVLCGNSYPSIDHIKPVSKGGLHSWDNVQLAHRLCNALKSNKVV